MSTAEGVELWRHELTAAALIGTDRRRPPRVPPELGVSAADGLDARTDLLDQAALHDVLIRAGRRPRSAAAIAAAPAEARATAPAAAAEILGVLLTQPPVPLELRMRLIRLWLDSAARNDLIVPPRLLPALLDLARADSAVGVALESAWGSRGAWLADRLGLPARATPDTTSPARLDEDVQALPTATAADTVRSLRQSHPVAALRQLEAHWNDLPARTREACLTALDDQLSDADEEFLEAALGDGARGVREQARVLLGRLPGSRFAARMAARLQPSITVNRRLLSRRSVQVTPPLAIDDAAVRDGLEAPRDGVEPDRMSWLIRIVENAPLTTWTTATGLDAAHTLALLLPDQTLRRPLLETVRRQRDPAWAAAFLDQADAFEVIPFLEPGALEAWLIGGLRNSSVRAQTIQAGLSYAAEPWSDALAQAVLDRVRAGSDTAAHALELTPAQATALPPSALPRVREILATEGESRTRRALAAAVQYHSIARSIREALP